MTGKFSKIARERRASETPNEVSDRLLWVAGLRPRPALRLSHGHPQRIRSSAGSWSTFRYDQARAGRGETQNIRLHSDGWPGSMPDLQHRECLSSIDGPGHSTTDDTCATVLFSMAGGTRGPATRRAATHYEAFCAPVKRAAAYQLAAGTRALLH